MPNHTHLISVARQLKQELGRAAFMAKPRTEITELLRKVSGERATQIKSTLAAELTSALNNEAILVYPSLPDTTTGDTVRLYHASSVLGRPIDIIVHPHPANDVELGYILSKIKGKWHWGDHYPPNHPGPEPPGWWALRSLESPLRRGSAPG